MEEYSMEEHRITGGSLAEFGRKIYGKMVEKGWKLYGKATRSKISESGVGLVVIFILHFTYNEPIR